MHVYVSNSFGPHTYFEGDSFNLKLKNGSFLYLMNIRKSTYRIGETDVFAKEVWIYNPAAGKQFLMGTLDKSKLAPLAEELYQIVSDRTKHPKIKTGLKYVIDAFMNDDMEDNPEELPFN